MASAGRIVETKSGKGRTVSSEKPVRGKIIVHLDSGEKILCSKENITVLGYYK